VPGQAVTPTLGDLLRRTADRFGDRPLVLAGPDTRTYDEFVPLVNGLAHGLRSIGVRRGDPVAAVLPNSVELLLVWLATATLGAVAVPLNPALRDRELEPLLRHARVSVVVTDRPGAPWAATRRTIRVGQPGPGPSLAELARPARLAPNCPVSAEDPAAILYTSGTTGAPKGCVLTHAGYTEPAPAHAGRLGLRPDDRLLVCLPLFHLAGQAFTVGALQTGAAVGLREKFSAHRFWQDVADIDATVFRHLGEMLTLIVKDGRPPGAGHGLRLVYGAGARHEVSREFAERFGVTVVEGYGLSETNTVLCGYPDLPRAGSIGRPLPHVEVRIADRSGVAATPGTVGEIQVRRNPALMAGYHRDPERTRKAMAGSWFRTGDLGRVDRDGWFYFEARRTDIIRRRGENVDPAEVEEVLAEHPAVAHCAVVGQPTGTSDEDIAAFVVPGDAARLEAAELSAWCRTRLAAFKVPSSVAVVERLPMTATAKIDRSLLRTAVRGKEM
jgi:acyl-CoA synthetase (AMP-forming)/AMP-acid ligase II